ncbi:MAG: hypothetical protein ABI609_06130 [Acidobacteriota bacterium]
MNTPERGFQIVPRAEVPENKDRDTSSIDPAKHGLGTGFGVLGGAAAGAAVGAAGGPAGMAVGGLVGAVVGGLAGRTLGEVVNPTVEEAYWRAEHTRRPYGEATSFDAYRAAYRYGWEERLRQPLDRSFRDSEPELERGWEHGRGRSGLPWIQARPAAQDAWERVERARV